MRGKDTEKLKNERKRYRKMKNESKRYRKMRGKDTENVE